MQPTEVLLIYFSPLGGGGGLYLGVSRTPSFFKFRGPHQNLGGPLSTDRVATGKYWGPIGPISQKI